MCRAHSIDSSWLRARQGLARCYVNIGRGFATTLPVSLPHLSEACEAKIGGRQAEQCAEGASEAGWGQPNKLTPLSAPWEIPTLFDRPFSKLVTTGWSCGSHDDLRSKILTLGGMADFGAEETNVYVLQLTYHQGHSHELGKGNFGIGSRDAMGRWTNSVDQNYGGTKRFVVGEWKPEYGLGTYGVDPCRKTAWAVLNYNGDFAVADNIEPKRVHR